jgi:hypothetical protein
MAAALPFTVLNYFLTGWIAMNLDHYYLTSFKMMISLLVIFNLVVRFSSLLPFHFLCRIANSVTVTSRIQLPPLASWQNQLLCRNVGNHKMDAIL